MKIDMSIRAIDISNKGVLKTRSSVASQTRTIEMLWEYLHRRSPDRAKRLLRLLKEYTDAEVGGYGSRDALRAEIEHILDFTVELMDASYSIFADQRRKEVDDMLATEIIDRQYETQCTPLSKISDEALIESVKIALRKEPEQQSV